MDPSVLVSHAYQSTHPPLSLPTDPLHSWRRPSGRGPTRRTSSWAASTTRTAPRSTTLTTSPPCRFVSSCVCQHTHIYAWTTATTSNDRLTSTSPHPHAPQHNDETEAELRGARVRLQLHAVHLRPRVEGPCPALTLRCHASRLSAATRPTYRYINRSTDRSTDPPSPSKSHLNHHNLPLHPQQHRRASPWRRPPQ